MTDPRIEPVAKALWDHGRLNGAWHWHEVSEDTRERYRSEATAALAAADNAANGSDGLLARLSASGGRNIDLLARAEAAEKAVARVEAICKDTDGEWLDPEDECNNVGGILQALRGDEA